MPRTLPGETVLVQPQGDRRATALEVRQPSPDRVTPPCQHFEQGCGGCALQHWADAPYAAWKRARVHAALQRAGCAEPALAPLARTPPGARRRMDFAVLRETGGVLLGLHQAHASRVVDLQVCPVLHPALATLLAPLRLLMRGLSALRRSGSVLANLLADGADLLIRTDGPLAPTDRAKLAAFGTAHDVRRIAWSLEGGVAEIAFMLGAPHAAFDGHHVEPPPGAFMQASAQGEAAIVAAVLDALPARLTGRSRAVELFAGCGTIGFPLARRLRVQAYEGDAGSAACVRRAQAGSHLVMTQRDLARQPLTAKEMAGAALVVLDPPYGGCPVQMSLVAASRVPRIAYVSCNPSALARDAAMVLEAGYRLVGATPIDQFLWSAQVECVAVFGVGEKASGPF